MFSTIKKDAGVWGSDAVAPACSRQIAPNQGTVQLTKFDDEQQLVYGEVYAPGFPDSQGDFMTRETIQVMAHDFMRRGLVSKIDVNHSQQESGCYVVESFIARDNDDTFIPGSWVLGVKVPDTQTWSLIKSGELNGFSLDGVGVRVDTVIEVEMPETISGETVESDGHRHRFFVKYDKDGNFLGGRTDRAPDGHWHEILRGTATELTGGHSHRFSFVEGVLNAQAAN